jgi:hypothetical protein
MDIIPNAVSLTVYSGGAEDFLRTPLQSLVEQVEAGTLRIYVGAFSTWIRSQMRIVAWRRIPLGERSSY